jgi:hypothetical protein
MTKTLANSNLLIKSLIPLAGIFMHTPAGAKEGMWVPATLKAHAQDLKSSGLEIPVDQIYNENGTGLNNAVVLFGRGCTGELISSKGLVLTNHHCGYGSIQGLSTNENDYFAVGFWAMNLQQELPCKGLTVTFIRRMENVSGQVLAGISDTLNDAVRDSMIALRIAAVEKDFKKSTGMDASIKPYFKGNQYWVAITETYTDIRLVGFPPNGIGAFGGDVENWSWPRHTGDFSIFRVYAGADNKPAAYSASNKPYSAAQHLHINVSGYKEGDFTMVYGFPGTTDEYISSYALRQVYEIADPIAIDARTRKLEVWNRHMALSRDIFLKYTAKRAGVANGWKKWQGEEQGLNVDHVTAKKQLYEHSFQKWADADKTAVYARNLLPQMKMAATAADQLLVQDQYNKEAVLGVELIQQGAALENVIKCFRLGLDGAALNDTLKKVMTGMAWFSKNYDAYTDKDVFVSLMSLYFSKCSTTLPDYFQLQYKAYNQDLTAWADHIYNTSLLTSQDKLNAFAAKATAGDSTRILSDAAWQLYDAINTQRKQKILPVLNDYYANMRTLNRTYMKAQMEKDKTKTFYPDANLTLRLSWGQVKGLKPDGLAKYSYQTNLGEVMALDNPQSDIFKVPEKLEQLYKTKDYGRWGVKGTMPVAFIASNHTTGGNSGSPLLNSHGELIGINFDRAYEGTMSDYYFDPNRCRNISVDIRYILFLIDKFGDAGWLIDEMDLVHTAAKVQKGKSRK